MRWFILWAGIVLTAAITVVSALLDTPEAESQLGVHVNSAWVTVGALAAFILFVGARVIGLERENARLKEARPNLTVALRDPEAIGVLDGRHFQIAVSNEPGFAASLQTRVSVQDVQPPLAQNVRLPAQLQSWAEDISPSDTAHFTVLHTQHGSTGGNQRAEAVCMLLNRPLSLDLIHGAERYEIFYRVTANNLPRGIDFYCAMKRRVVDNEYVWDVTWGLGSKPEPKK